MGAKLTHVGHAWREGVPTVGGMAAWSTPAKPAPLKASSPGVLGLLRDIALIAPLDAAQFATLGRSTNRGPSGRTS